MIMTSEQIIALMAAILSSTAPTAEAHRNAVKDATKLYLEAWHRWHEPETVRMRKEAGGRV